LFTQVRSAHEQLLDMIQVQKPFECLLDAGRSKPKGAGKKDLAAP